MSSFGQPTRKRLENDDIAGEEKSEENAEEEENIRPPFLCRPLHKLSVIDAEKKTNGKDWKKAAIENLGNQDYPHSVNYQK